ncbi:mandelate racemase/muconate lactonizing enzyme family protein [Streptomyces poriferorum]|uniref:Mandelate racemase/muconate lactonizing enzyme family protein n=1 Tax=Streptomyces poriferorum TaxID=2798799 RepID=A0ABY9II22_9ACTN|nr:MULTISPECIES: mandelate racemase/muconate lactonizing enzyme family protein [unclassified Streptomyces]MDP5316164.1 mandelate racemase/muconate lactonizing enzyme family protein [Streptomyces sp. Alt4]ROQ77799.1 L-alanine-DL-glutamate epimerase-like enolase superfamily enzyme [Streptomyces sp. CEV 2-1]RPK38751.1 Mandelate racemase [Streptomyces sp. ADI92-24]WLQ52734.1 mandelate racemase/muconate lactonizing enzyme family protein [Streptomyces sp. Alt1]WLQ54499.1 mandelate racemase/muconate 
MTMITKASALLADIAVETDRTDAVQSFVKQETILVTLTTTDGIEGTGYAYTIGTGGTSVLALLRDHLLPLLAGKDARNVEGLWQELFGLTRATTTGAITSLALAAIDTALWDLRCKRSGEPLWRLAGGHRREIPVYDTEGGWLHLGTDELVESALAAKQAQFAGVKIKVGKPHPAEDAERLRAVREAVGPYLHIMTDANQSQSLSSAVQLAAALEPYDPYWLEEPMPADDISGHARLARSTRIPIAVGESMYSPMQFRTYLETGAASVVQVDVARVGGITPWLKVAHLAETFNVKVCPHFLMELHVSLVGAVSNGAYVEYIPQLRAVTRTEMTVRDGLAVAPDEPGIGIDWDMDAIDRRRVS